MNKRKLLVLAMTLCMVAILAIGGTLAYFTDTDEVNNVFTMGNVDITLDESKVIKNEDKWFKNPAERVQENEYTDVYPGAKLPKDPTVHNVGSYDAYVRVKVTVDFNKLAAMQKDKILFNGATQDEDLTNIANIDSANWTCVAVDYNPFGDDRTVTYTYTYNHILTPKAEATLFNTISIPDFITNEDVAGYGLGEFEINVVGEAIQTVGFANAGEAWETFDAE